MLTKCSYPCFIFHPYLVSFPFYAIPICPPFRNPYDFLFTCIIEEGESILPALTIRFSHNLTKLQNMFIIGLTLFL